MKKLLPLTFATVLPFLLGACCSKAQVRFWQVRDTTTKTTAYTVDTVGVPAATINQRNVKYVNSGGDYVQLTRPKIVRQMSQQEWQAATSGARYSVFYCGICKDCWAVARHR